jgi:uncharacterized repeat protein (TIGR01451 family)
LHVSVTSRPGLPKRLWFILCCTVVPVILLMGLTQASGAEVDATPGTEGQELSRSALLAYEPGAFICKQAYNRVPNPGFEQGIGVIWDSDGRDCLFADGGPGHAGDHSAVITATRTLRHKCMFYTPINQITVEPGRYYDYSVWVKGSPTGTAYLSISFWRFQGTFQRVGDPALTLVLTDTQETWVELTGSVVAPTAAEYARIEATLGESSQGYAWFDDVYFGLAGCLDVSKSDTPPWVYPGDLLTYTISYTNTGRETVRAATVVETYDDAVTFESADPMPTSGDGTWVLDLQGGGSGLITAVVRVDEGIEGRNWLVNRVEMGSVEIQNPITDVVYTNVVTDGTCGIYLDVIPPAQTASPGHTVGYDLALFNVGEFDGQAVLTATSDLDLGTEFGQSTFSLPSQGSGATSLQLHIPVTMPVPALDTTLITATLTCNEYVAARDQELISTTIKYYYALIPAAMRDFCSYEPWESEPNNTCSYEDADSLLCLDHDYYGYPNDEWDWFRLETAGGFAVELTADQVIGEEEKIQLLLCDEDCTVVGWDNTPENGYRIDAPGASGRHYIGIYKESGFSTDWTYTLRVIPL